MLPIPDDSRDDILRYLDKIAPLAKAPKLKTLKVGKLMPAGIDELKKAKPELQIIGPQ